jgi:hypothetical protein
MCNILKDTIVTELMHVTLEENYNEYPTSSLASPDRCNYLVWRFNLYFPNRLPLECIVDSE